MPDAPDPTDRTSPLARFVTATTPLARVVAHLLGPIAVGVIGAWLGMALWGPTAVPMGPFQVRLEGEFGRGVTEVALPPFGKLTADTHLAPLRFAATLEDVRVPELSTLVAEKGTQGLVSDVEQDALDRVFPYAIRLFLVSLAGAAVASVVVFRLHWHAHVIAIGTAFIIVGVSQIAAWATFSPGAFTSPTFSGSLELAPKLIGPVRQATDRIEDFRAELDRVVTGAVRAYTSIRLGTVSGEAAIRVLHISDVHISPLGQDFAAQIAKGFDVQAVIDTGDLTSFGTRPEQFVLRSIRELGLPYVYVRGNHDSRALERAMEGIDNAIVLDGDTAEVAGLTVYGLGHPVFTPDLEASVTDRQFAEAARAAGERVLADVTALPVPPDVVAVHDDRMAEAAAGYVPLVVSGHFHETKAFERDGTLFLRVGTTGGSGFEVFTAEGGIPLTAEVLYFEPGSPPKLIAWDVIQQSPETGDLTVHRHVVQQEFGELVPSPPPIEEGVEEEQGPEEAA